MRIRTIKPEFHQDEEMSEVSAEAALLAVGLLNYADDQGWFKFHSKLIESSVFPLRELSVSIHDLLTELSNMGYFTLHDGSDGKKYGYISNFLKHQRVNRPSPSKIAPIIVELKDDEPSPTPHELFSEDSLTERNREQGTGKGKEQGKGKDTPKPPEGGKPSALSLPHGNDFAEAWRLWEKHRKEIRKPLKPTMISGQLKKLEAMSEPEAVAMIEHTISMGWTGLRPDDSKPQSRSDGTMNEGQVFKPVAANTPKIIPELDF